MLEEKDDGGHGKLSSERSDELGVEVSRTDVLESRGNSLEDRDGVFFDGEVSGDLP